MTRRMMLGVLGMATIGIRMARARHRRILHPAGRSFTGTLEVWGAAGEPTGAQLVDRPAVHPVTVRISKGAGTPGSLPDVLGLAVRVHGPGPGDRQDLLLSTAGTARLSRHLPLPRWGFDTGYGSILSYRTGTNGARTYLAAVPDPAGPRLGRSLDAVTATAADEGATMLLTADGVPFGRLSFGDVLPDSADAELAFDPIRNTTDDLLPTGLIHASRALVYRAAQRWRRVLPATPDRAAVTRTATHH